MFVTRSPRPIYRKPAFVGNFIVWLWGKQLQKLKVGLESKIDVFTFFERNRIIPNQSAKKSNNLKHEVKIKMFMIL